MLDGKTIRCHRTIRIFISRKLLYFHHFLYSFVKKNKHVFHINQDSIHLNEPMRICFFGNLPGEGDSMVTFLFSSSTSDLYKAGEWLTTLIDREYLHIDKTSYIAFQQPIFMLILIRIQYGQYRVQTHVVVIYFDHLCLI